MGKFLTADDRKELLEELRFERSRKYADRIRVIPISKNNAYLFEVKIFENPQIFCIKWMCFFEQMYLNFSSSVILRLISAYLVVTASPCQSLIKRKNEISYLNCRNFRKLVSLTS